MWEKRPCVYILCDHYKGALYTGVTADLIRRIHQHRNGEEGGFTARYGIKRLVWYEWHPDMKTAIKWEKRIKRWSRARKYWIIETMNPKWEDLYETRLT